MYPYKNFCSCFSLKNLYWWSLPCLSKLITFFKYFSNLIYLTMIYFYHKMIISLETGNFINAIARIYYYITMLNTDEMRAKWNFSRLGVYYVRINLTCLVRIWIYFIIFDILLKAKKNWFTSRKCSTSSSNNSRQTSFKKRNNTNFGASFICYLSLFTF